MRLRVGYELVYECPQPTPMLLILNTHDSRALDMVVPDHIYTDPPIPLRQYRDSLGNLCTRLTAPRGVITLSSRAVFDVPPEYPELPEANGCQHAVEELPDDA